MMRSNSWYKYADDRKHLTRFEDQDAYLYTRDRHGILDVRGDYEMSICGKVSPIVSKDCTDPATPYCENCYILSLMQELGE